MANGSVNTKGLNVLIEIFCSNNNSKIKENNTGAGAASIAMFSGVNRRANKTQRIKALNFLEK